MLGALTGVALGNFAIFSSPIYIGSLIDGFGFAESQAGLISTLEIGAVATTCLMLSSWLDRASLRSLATAGVIVLLSANLLSFTLDQFYPVLVARIGAGVGAGICLACASALLSRMQDPDRMVGLLLAAMSLIMVIMLTLMGHAKSMWMFNGFVGLYSLLALVLSPLLFFLPREPFSETPLRQSFSPSTGNYFALGVLGLTLFFFFCVLEGGVWSFSERRGVSLGMDDRNIGLLLGLTQLAGLSGAVLAAILGGRIRRNYPIIIGISLMGSAGLLIYQTDLAFIYASCLGLFGFAFAFTFPYLLGAFAKLDADGSWAARANGVNLIGGASGPFVVATVVSVSDFHTLGLFCFGIALTSLLLAATFNSMFSRVEQELSPTTH